MQFRDYQERLVLNLANALTRVRKVLAQLATGGGKTVVFSAITQRFIDKNPTSSVLILVHRKELLQQTRRTLYNNFGIVSHAIVAGVKHVPYSQVYVGMVESVTKRIQKLPKIGLLIIDEAHIANFNKVHDFFPESLIIGFTATPISSNKKKPLKDFYDEIVCGVDIPELIEKGFLCQNFTVAPIDIVQRAALTIKNGEYDESKMAEEYSSARHINNAVKKYEEWAKGDKMIVFNCNIEHSIAVTNAFKVAGYNAKHLDGTMNSSERTFILNWYKNTEDAILCNVAVATTGYDEPSIKTVMVNKSTLSKPLWLQTTGRGSRIYPGKKLFKILDMGGNGAVHGDWNDPVDWTELFYNPKKPKDASDQVAPCKSCPNCEALIPSQAGTCTYCGYVFPKKERAEEEEMCDMVVITKGINVQQLIHQNEGRKDFYTFFEVGRKIAEKARMKFPHLTDEIINTLFLEYEIHVKRWCKEIGKQYSGWHKNLAKEHLLKELSLKFTEKKLQPLENLSQIQMMQMI